MIDPARHQSTVTMSRMTPGRPASGRARPGPAKVAQPVAPAQANVAPHVFAGWVALWFGALFGLGSLAAGGDALGAMVQYLHLAAIVPAAAPPLGWTALILAALALGGLGAGVGLVIGRMLAARVLGTGPVPRAAGTPRAVAPARSAVSSDRLMRVRNRDAHPDAPPRRPLVVTEDVLPYATAQTAVEAPITPFETTPVAAPTDFAAFAPPAHDTLRFDPSAPFVPIHDDGEPAIAPPPFLASAFAPMVEPDPVAAPVAVEPAARAPSPPPVSTAPLASRAAAAPNPALTLTPLASLGLVQLIERLALAIDQRRSRLAASAPQMPDPAPHSACADLSTPLHMFDPASMDPAGPLLRTKPSPRAAVPDAATPAAQAPGRGRLRDPLEDIGKWADEDAADHPVQFPWAEPAGDDHAAKAAGDQTTGVAGDSDKVEDRYSALTDMTLPRHELAPSLDPSGAGPVVRFMQRMPGAEAHSMPVPPEMAASDADRALRDALATLRRMSGAR